MQKNKRLLGAVSLVATLLLSGCVSSSDPSARLRSEAEAAVLLEESFVLAVFQHIYRWHFDQSFFLDAPRLKNLEVWARRVHPGLDADDQSEFAELWIPAVNMLVELKRSDYRIPEMDLRIADSSFKICRVTRQRRPPAARSAYHTGCYAASVIQDYLFSTRANQVPASDNLRATARTLIVEYLAKTSPDPFTEEQIFYVAPISTVSNDLWVFWETGRKLMLFSADMDLTHPGFAQLSQLKMDVIDLDTDVVTSSKEVPGSNVFVTKDWVGRVFFNCILYGERLVRTPEQVNSLRTDPAGAL